MFLTTVVFGQQKPQFSQFMFNKYFDNPAYGGLERSLAVDAIYRDQYSELLGHPSTIFVAANMPLYIWNGAVGATLLNQKAGVLSSSQVTTSYNYVIGTSMGFLSFGGRAGINYTYINSNAIRTPDGSYEGLLNHNDPILDNDNFTGIGLLWEVGAYFMGKQLEAGLTVSDFPQHSHSIGSASYNRITSVSFFSQYKVYINEQLNIIPAMLIKTDFNELQIDYGGIFDFKNSFFCGITGRGFSKKSIDAIGLIIGTNIGSKYKISYGYDIGLSALKSAHQGTHEIMLRYNLNKLIGIGLPPKIIYNPRHL